MFTASTLTELTVVAKKVPVTKPDERNICPVEIVFACR